jgi:hypothetical protein
MQKIVLFLAFLAAGLGAQDFSNKTLGYPFYPHTDTPGATYSDLKQEELCEVGYTKSVRNVSTYTKHQVFAHYGITVGHFREYEVDHFISLELGGSNAFENLFPQPYEIYLNVNGTNMRMGAREKDVVETNLHKRVCNGEITLKEAQTIITTNWVGYYLKLKNKIL